MPTQEAQGRILGIDFGIRRTGLARSDVDRILATGLPTFEPGLGRSLRRHLETLHSESKFTGVVLGAPRRADGRLGGPRDEILALGEWIHRVLTVPVAYWDESGSSIEASTRLREAPRKVRRDRAKVDQMAACVILQEFLDAGCPFAENAGPEPVDTGHADGSD